METTASVLLPAAPSEVFPIVADLGTTTRWLPLVHRVESVGPDAWDVELRAAVGPFARSKRLRMVRVDHRPDVGVRFERAEIDGRHHAPWILRCDLEPRGASTVVTMHLVYLGRLWTPGPLSRVLDQEVQRGRDGLLALFDGSSSSPN
ncbi:MAG: SRPBCC family protein [Ilumatobacteraceae bacterium]